MGFEYLIRKLFRTCTTRDPEAVEASSGETAVAPTPTASQPTSAVSEKDGDPQESPSTPSPSGEDLLPAKNTPKVLTETQLEVREEIEQQNEQQKASCGHEIADRIPPMEAKPVTVKSETLDLSGTTVAETGSSSNTQALSPVTPKRSRTVAALDTDGEGDTESPRKRRMETAQVTVKTEPDEYDPGYPSGPPTPVVKHEDEDEDEEDEEDEDEKSFLISPDTQRHYDQGPSLAPIPFSRALVPSSSNATPATPPPPGVPFRHPCFPSRAPLRCRRGYDHQGFEVKYSRSIHNPDRWFYTCAQCQNFICWADAAGVYSRNPTCNCGYPTREDISSERVETPRVLFYRCATNKCLFKDGDWENPLSKAEVNAYFGRIVYPEAE
ncbi:hypothetical protein F5Y11DRAFT_353299 [Daldinia sp. FL1419]|nr:hypothetical protein F5Y11DRAFT_353299 [Daldinia sp. FL1419]